MVRSSLQYVLLLPRPARGPLETRKKAHAFAGWIAFLVCAMPSTRVAFEASNSKADGRFD